MAKKLHVTHDDDGGLTVDDKDHSGVMVSIIRSNPLANGPRQLFIEVYAYKGDRQVAMIEVETGRRHKLWSVITTEIDAYEKRPDVKWPQEGGE